jgi:hypothetical protein
VVFINPATCFNHFWIRHHLQLPNYPLRSRSHKQLFFDYQLFLYQSTAAQREQGMANNTISQHLNEQGYMTSLGKKFRAAHIHLIFEPNQKKRVVQLGVSAYAFKNQIRYH